MKLVKILPDRIQIKTDDVEFACVRLNDLVSVSDGEAELVAQICAITDNDVETQMDDNTIMEELQQPSLKVIEGSILGSLVGGEFKQQIDHYPSMNVCISKITDRKFADMLCGSDMYFNGFKIGEYAGYETDAWINGNKFYQRHSCIVGNTGCGKSETVAKILEETVGSTNCNIIVFDIHGEYGNLSYTENIRVGETPFPIWMLGFSDMVTNILKVKEDSVTVMSALRKAYYSCCHSGGNENKPLYFRFEDIVEYVKNLNEEKIEAGVYASGEKKGMIKTVNGDYYGKLSGIVNAMETLYADRRYSFLFDDLGQRYLFDFLNRIMGGNKPVKNIDLSGIPHDIAVLIIGAVAKLVYNIQILQKDAVPITLVCDEAHVYIPTDFQLTASKRRMVEIFENIAKEGRKFGITLLVATQRPSELNRTIFAQCENCIVMKLNNENDKAIVKDRVKGGDAIVDSTAMFSPGDCLIIGDSCPVPLKIHVGLAKERPQSKTISFFDEWKKERKESDYTEWLKEYLAD